MCFVSALVALIVGIGILAFKRYRKSKPDVEAASGAAAAAAPPKSTRRASRAMQSAIIAAYSSDKNDMETAEYYNEKLPPLAPQAVGRAYSNSDGDGAFQAYNPSGMGGLPATYTGPDGRYSVRR